MGSYDAMPASEGRKERGDLEFRIGQAYLTLGMTYAHAPGDGEKGGTKIWVDNGEEETQDRGRNAQERGHPFGSTREAVDMRHCGLDYVIWPRAH